MLSGVGVAFKLVMALEGENCDVSSLLDNYSDLLCIGTVGDIVELKAKTECLSSVDLLIFRKATEQVLMLLLKPQELPAKDYFGQCIVCTCSENKCGRQTRLFGKIGFTVADR